jgi:hypothetical protein
MNLTNIEKTAAAVALRAFVEHVDRTPVGEELALANKIEASEEAPKPQPIEAADVTDLLSRFVNRMGVDQDAPLFVEAILHDHRTLQQQTFGLFVLCIQGWAKAHGKGWFDDRNEFTCRLSALMMKAIASEWCGRVPMI